MIQNTIFKILLAPFSLLYGLGISFRDFMYSKELLKAIEFDVPVISVGNLSLGGAGKTPHVEYLIRLLKPYINIATLSRGYKRKTKGFLLVNSQHNAETVGDEPLQYKRKFPDLLVSVAESRTFAIPQIVMEGENMQAILLDDAFQHRSIKPGLNILLTEFDRPFTKDFLLPSGRLREWRTAYKRADVIVVSKCPKVVSPEERDFALAEINPFPWQQVYFSYYEYLQPYYILNRKYVARLTKEVDILLICAIAGTDYLVDSLKEKVNSVKILEYEDHHYFSKYDVANLKTTFDKIESNGKIIVTTEKDAMRLEMHREFLIKEKLPIFVLPVEVKFHFEEGQKFNQQVKDFLLDFRA